MDAQGACRQGVIAAGDASPQARRHVPGGIMGLPTQSRSGDGSSGIAATTGNVRAQGTAPNLQAALTGGGGELCGHVLPRGSAIGHRAFAWVWGIAGRAGRVCGRAPPLARVHLCLV